MNRTIKFRGKRIDTGEWVYGYYFIDIENNLPYIMLGKRIESTQGYMIRAVEITAETVGQFTGSFDISGTDVYEGDVIENCDTKALQVVYWRDDEAAWYCRYVEDEKRIVSLADSLGNLNEVIGNIHENPELLNETK